MSYPTRNTSTFTLPGLNTGVMLKEDGFALLTESGDEIKLENPDIDPMPTSRNTSSYSLPNRS